MQQAIFTSRWRRAKRRVATPLFQSGFWEGLRRHEVARARQGPRSLRPRLCEDSSNKRNPRIAGGNYGLSRVGFSLGALAGVGDGGGVGIP